MYNLVTFDRFNNPLSALYLNNGYISFPFGIYDDDKFELYVFWDEKYESLHLLLGTQIFELPVINIILKSCPGVSGC